jgi:hypothetical protein
VGPGYGGRTGAVRGRSLLQVSERTLNRSAASGLRRFANLFRRALLELPVVPDERQRRELHPLVEGTGGRMPFVSPGRDCRYNASLLTHLR